MLRSMTGFGSGRCTVEGEQLSVEIRSVNQKFIDVKARLPRELAALEPELVAQVRGQLLRGTIDVQVHRQALAGNVAVVVDLPLATEYRNAFEQLREALGSDERLSAQSIFACDGVVRLEERPTALEAARAALRQAAALALGQLREMREREGAVLGRDLGQRLAIVASLAQAVRGEAPLALAEHRRRLHGRIAELLVSQPDPERIAQEVALLAERTDIAEELTRLDSHLRQFGELVEGNEAVGRRLDFLAQELHREVTTLGNKSQSAAIGRLVIELKSEVERLREQVQNVE